MTIYKFDPLKPNCFYNPVREIIVLYKDSLALFQANIIQKYKEDLWKLRAWMGDTSTSSQQGRFKTQWLEPQQKGPILFYHKVKSSILDIMLQIGDFPTLP